MISMLGPTVEMKTKNGLILISLFVALLLLYIYSILFSFIDFLKLGEPQNSHLWRPSRINSGSAPCANVVVTVYITF